MTIRFLNYNDGESSVNMDGTLDTKTLPQIMRQQIQPNRAKVITTKDSIIKSIGNSSQNDTLFLFPKEYFCAKVLGTCQLENTDETYTIHHFAMSWIPLKYKFITNFKRRLIEVLGIIIIYGMIDLFSLKKIKHAFYK